MRRLQLKAATDAGSNTAAAAAGLRTAEVYAEEDLCVVCWEGQRSAALVHGNDAHLVRCTATGAAAAGV
jgi:hypothetical protein